MEKDASWKGRSGGSSKFSGRKTRVKSFTFSTASTSFRSHLRILQDKLAVQNDKTSEDKIQEQSIPAIARSETEIAEQDNSIPLNSLHSYSQHKHFSVAIQHTDIPDSIRTPKKYTKYRKRPAKRSLDTKFSDTLEDSKGKFNFVFRNKEFYSRLNSFYSKTGKIKEELSSQQPTLGDEPPLKSILKKTPKY